MVLLPRVCITKPTNYERGFRRPALPQAQLTAITTHHTTMPMRHATKHTPPPAAGTRTAPWPLRDRAIIQPPPGPDPPFVSQAGGGADFRASRLKRCTSPAGLSTRPLTRRGACARQRLLCSGLTPGCSTSCPLSCGRPCDHVRDTSLFDRGAAHACDECDDTIPRAEAGAAHSACRSHCRHEPFCRHARVRHLRICERPRFLRRASAAFLPLRW